MLTTALSSATRSAGPTRESPSPTGWRRASARQVKTTKWEKALGVGIDTFLLEPLLGGGCAGCRRVERMV